MRDPNNNIKHIKEFIKNRKTFYRGDFKNNPDYTSEDLIEYMIRNPLKSNVDDLMYENPSLGRTDVVNNILIQIDVKYLQKFREEILKNILNDKST